MIRLRLETQRRLAEQKSREQRSFERQRATVWALRAFRDDLAARGLNGMGDDLGRITAGLVQSVDIDRMQAAGRGR
jgi:hypothetical protein